MSFRKTFFWLTFLAGVGFSEVLLAQADTLPTPLSTVQQKAGYGIGLDIGARLSRSGMTEKLVDLQSILLGIQDGIRSQKPRVSQEQIQGALQQVDKVALANVEKKMLQFVEKYKALQGVRSLPSGVLYKVLKPGTGPSPTATDRVKTHYRGRLYDGTEFDSSYRRNEPAVFPLNGVIPGWTEALQQMKVGGKWQLVIPPNMAYGDRGSPPVIPPNAWLVFDIELLEIVQGSGR